MKAFINSLGIKIKKQNLKTLYQQIYQVIVWITYSELKYLK